MIAIAAAQLGIRAVIFAPDAIGSPAADVAHAIITASYDDKAALDAFALQVDAVVTEFENVPADTMAYLGQSLLVCPGSDALRVAQNRIAEKTLARDLGINVPDFWAITSADELADALVALNGRGIVKTTTLGYDGKGQIAVDSTSDAKTVWEALGTHQAILESFVSFSYEVSFLVWRTKQGETGCFPAAENRHENGILARTVAPAPSLSPDLYDAGSAAAIKIADAVGLEGVLAMEAFITTDGTMLFNEIAPRPHNSFHWTIEGCETSQFTQLVRIACGHTPGSTAARATFTMDNLLGEHMGDVAKLLNRAGVSVHLYGKPDARTGRKMGHATWQSGR
jgi:5-(carboxyamino)imidazole ribonucleotide synthase